MWLRGWYLQCPREQEHSLSPKVGGHVSHIRHSCVGTLLGDTQAGADSSEKFTKHLLYQKRWTQRQKAGYQCGQKRHYKDKLTTQPYPTLIVGKIRFQALSMCSSSSQEKINPQQLLFYRKRFTDFNMPAKKKKYSQFDSFASLIGNGRDGWFPTEFFASELVLNLIALPLDSIQVSRRWQGCHSLSPSGQL